MNDRVVTAVIVTTTRMRTGTGSGGSAADLEVLRDTSGRPYLPGTQIAGRLREAATRLAPALGLDPCQRLREPNEDHPRSPICSCPVCRVFGTARSPGEMSSAAPAGADVEEGREADGDDDAAARASSVWCFDAHPVTDPGESGTAWPETMIADGVGISRTTGASAAEARAKYEAEWLEPGSAFELRLELAADAPPKAEELLALSLSEWASGRGRLGAAAARGGGAFEIRDLRFRRADLSEDALIGFLRTDPGERGAAEDGWLREKMEKLRPAPSAVRSRSLEELPRGAASHFVALDIVLGFDGPVVLNDPAAAAVHGTDFAPAFVGYDWTEPVLPGSSLRGVLRSQMERIARTVAMEGIVEEVSGEEASGRVLAERCPACHPFSRPEEDGAQDAWLSCDRAAELLNDGDREQVSDCLACRLFGNTRRGSRLWIEDGPLSEDSTAAYRLRDFVAIDRFTGGALAGAKFDALPLFDPAFRVELLLWNARDWELAALGLALRDLHDGLATLGARGAVGFGRIRLEQMTLTVGSLVGDSPRLPEMQSIDPGHGVFDLARWSGSIEEFVAAAAERGWIGAFRDECVRHRRELPPSWTVHDGYATRQALRLYRDGTLRDVFAEEGPDA